MRARTHARLHALQTRGWGQLWHAGLARLYQVPLVGKRSWDSRDRVQPRPTPTDTTTLPEAPCPLCGLRDSGGHILGGCKERSLHAMYIKRHNVAVQIVADAIHKGTRGGCYTVMDACAEEASREYSAGTRLPSWLLPGASNAVRAKMRPDLLLIPSLPTHATDGTPSRPYRGPTQRDQHTVHIIEVGYTGDLRHNEKNAEKSQQHESLASALRTAGWKVQYDKAEAVTLGVGGTIRKDLRPLLISLGAPALAATQCCVQLHEHAVRTANDIILRRRKLEQGAVSHVTARQNQQARQTRSGIG